MAFSPPWEKVAKPDEGAGSQREDAQTSLQRLGVQHDFPLVAERDLQFGQHQRQQRVELRAVALGELVARVARVFPVDLAVVELVEPGQPPDDVPVEAPEVELGGMAVDKERREPVAYHAVIDEKLYLFHHMDPVWRGMKPPAAPRPPVHWAAFCLSSLNLRDTDPIR